MPAALRWSRIVVLFVAAAGFLFGQIFNGTFSLAGTLAGIGGLLAGTIRGAARRGLVLAGCVMGLAGAALHAWEYYSAPQVSGNYYPWFLTLPFAAGLLLIAWAARHDGPRPPDSSARPA